MIKEISPKKEKKKRKKEKFCTNNCKNCNTMKSIGTKKPKMFHFPCICSFNS